MGKSEKNGTNSHTKPRERITAPADRPTSPPPMSHVAEVPREQPAEVATPSGAEPKAVAPAKDIPSGASPKQTASPVATIRSCGAAGEQCLAELRELLADPERKWIRGQPQASDYTSGIRLFAYRGSVKSLTCEELDIGLSEMRVMAQALDLVLGDKTRTLQARQQLELVRSMSTTVQSELEAEKTVRCPKPRT